jgi:transposase InsO family protein
MRDHMRVELTLSALLMAVQRQRPPADLLQHSGRGSQYVAEAYVAQLAAMGAVPSMSRKGYCYDNAPMESFFHTLKVELAHGEPWATRDSSPISRATTIEPACTPPSAISRPSKPRSAWQAKSSSTQMEEDQC